MKHIIASSLKSVGNLGTGILLLGIFAPLTVTSSIGLFFVTIGYAMLLLAFGGHVLDIRLLYPSRPWRAAIYKAVHALFAHLSTSTFVTGLGQVAGAFVAPVAVASVATTLLLSMVMTIICVGAYFAYRHILDC
ncbi:hypothetical protein [Halomonas sp. KO116]|uniref:hypothetical protein n=1 Tax=Halomonas sp. KO116 TaxID=1504981 RepID=UPI0004E41B80|nr:hypothetical protein [Halomonas sp. KO116]AJY53315.1 hypothetical protein KO116_P200208 [Halomonas sp. KO116]